TEVVHAVEETQAGPACRGHLAELLLDFLPVGHRGAAPALSGEARHEHPAAVALLNQGAKPVRDLESSLIIDFGRSIAPEDGRRIHFGPLWSTEMVGIGLEVVNAKF